MKRMVTLDAHALERAIAADCRYHHGFTPDVIRFAGLVDGVGSVPQEVTGVFARVEVEVPDAKKADESLDGGRSGTRSSDSCATRPSAGP